MKSLGVDPSPIGVGSLWGEMVRTQTRNHVATQKMAMHKPRRVVQKKPTLLIPWSWTLSLQRAFILWENKCLWFKPPSLWYLLWQPKLVHAPWCFFALAACLPSCSVDLMDKLPPCPRLYLLLGSCILLALFTLGPSLVLFVSPSPKVPPRYKTHPGPRITPEGEHIPSGLLRALATPDHTPLQGEVQWFLGRSTLGSLMELGRPTRDTL